MFNSLANEILFGGASEGGKSYGGRYALSALCAAVPNLQCYIFRKYYGDCISNHMEGPTSFPELLRPWIEDKLVQITENEVRFTFNNSLIQLHGLLYDKDLEKHVGREKHVLWIDEAGQIKRRHIDGLRAWVRMPKDMKDKLPEQLKGLFPQYTPEQLREFLPRILYTTNPEGESVGFFRRQFVQGHKAFEVWRADDKQGGFLRAFIPSLITDNPAADAEAQRRRLLPLGEARANALITGDWSAPTGDYFKEYDDDLHAVPDFTPPADWFKYRAFDWGSAEPFAVGWYCVSDSQEFIDEKGRTRWFPRGAIIKYREWYGCQEEDTSIGLHMSNQAIAQGILSRTKEVMSGLTVTDRYPFADRGDYQGSRKYTMADTFSDEGVPLTLGNCKRIHGWSEMRYRLRPPSGPPMLYICESCRFTREYIPALPYHPTNEEDAAEHGESTHVCDETRLACALRPIIKDQKPALPPQPKDGSICPAEILTKLKTQTKYPYYARR